MTFCGNGRVQDDKAKLIQSVGCSVALLTDRPSFQFATCCLRGLITSVALTHLGRETGPRRSYTNRR